jgi:glucose/arabinose dehydrogenase
MNTFSRLTLTVLGCVALAAVPVTAFAAVASGFAVETVASGLNLPTAFLYTPDGEMLVAEKDGVVRLVENGVVRSTPVLTIQNVNTYADHGLIGIAYDETQHYLYALFTYENNPANPIGPKTGRLSRYTLDPTHTAIPGSEVVILGTVVGDALAPSCQSFPIGTDCIPSDEPSHSVADLGFGPDGKLYVSIGDGASFDVVDPLALRSQNLDMLSGKVLRINPDGSAPSDNPFYTGNANDNRSKVYAYGFRNPFRFSFRPTNQALIVGDVGWYTAEELNVITPGGNYGWPCHEGFNQAPGYNCVAQGSQDPLYAYFHDELGSGSITGGVFYTGGTYPSSYAGSYFFGDFSQDWVKHVVLDAENNLISVEDFVTEAGGPVDFAQDPQGNINYLSIYSGEVRRIIAVSGNRNPTVALSATPSNGLAPLSVQFSSDGSIDPDGDTISYSWDFGDGVLSSLSAPTHVYNANGVYQAVLTVSDGNGGSASKSLTVTVGNRAPTATIVNPPANSFYTGGQLIPLVSSATDPEDGALPASAYRWTVILHHNVHYHILEYLTGPNPSFVAPSHGTDQDVHIEIQLRVVDSGGLAHIVTRHFYQAPPATVSPFHISSTADAASVGMPVRISTELGNSGGTAPFLVDLELFDAAGTRVAQTFYDGVAIPTGGTSTYTMTYTPVTSGPYRLAVGLIYAGWQGLYQWVDNALTFINLLLSFLFDF